MKWDYATVTKWGIDEDGPDGKNGFLEAVVELARRLDGKLEPGPLLNGYQQAYRVTREGEVLVQCLTAGTGSAAGSSMFDCAHTAAEVYPVLQEMFPEHNATRLDACEDYSGEGSWDALESILTRVCTEHGVSMAPYGEGHKKPDGSRDTTKGRSWYCGSKASPFRVVLYEKGLEQIAKGIPDDPTRVRLEVRIRPASHAKGVVGGMRLVPSDLLGMSRWGKALGNALGAQGVPRVYIGSVWRPNEQEQVAMKIVRMFDRGLEHLLDLAGSAEAVGVLLYQVQEKVREAKAAHTAPGVQVQQEAKTEA